MSGPVDVLAVMVRDRGDAYEARCGKFKGEHTLRLSQESDEARAAVAELIEADRAFDHAAASKIEADNRIVSGDDRSDDAFRRKCSADHAYDRATDRRKAALGLVGGAQ